jgi:hypothetical protein
MATADVIRPPYAAEKNIHLNGEVMRYLIENPQMLEVLPREFELVILPDDDPELRAFNLALLERYGSPNESIVFVWVHTKQHAAGNKPNGAFRSELSFQFFVPVTA